MICTHMGAVLKDECWFRFSLVFVHLFRFSILFFSGFAYIIFMAALCNRSGTYIFVLWFLLSFYLFSSPIVSRRRLDVYHTSIHGVALVQI